MAKSNKRRAPAPDPRLPAQEGVRRIALRLVAAASAVVPRLEGEAHDPDALHDFRVAIRRLRSWLKPFEPLLLDTLRKRVTRGLRALMKATNDSRDSEVQLGLARDASRRCPPRVRPVFLGFLGLLQHEVIASRGPDRPALAADFRRLEVDLLDGLSRYRREFRLDEDLPPPAFGTVHAAALNEALREFQQLIEAAVVASDAAPLHAVRIGAKRLRYLLEPLQGGAGARRLVTRLSALQSVLGDLHDRQVAIEKARLVDPDQLGWYRTPLENAVSDGAESFRQQWVVEELPRINAAVLRIIGSLGRAGREGLEIERKYLLRGRPDAIQGLAPSRILQGWLPGKRLRERVRSITPAGGPPRFLRTLKGGLGVSRIEIEEETTAEVFRGLWPLTRGRRIDKDRYVIADGDLTWEIDVFRGRRLVLAEVEIASADFDPPIPDWLAPWIVRDVTGLSRYTNSKLAR